MSAIGLPGLVPRFVCVQAMGMSDSASGCFKIKTRYVDADRGEIFAVSEEYRQLVGHKSHQDHGGFDASQIRARPEMTLPLSSRWSWLWRKQVPATCGEKAERKSKNKIAVEMERCCPMMP